MLVQVCCDREQKRTGPRDHHAFTANRQACFHHSLQPSGTHHIWQSPTRKWQEPFPRSRGQHQIVISQLEQILRAFGEKNPRLRIIEHSFAENTFDVCSLQTKVPLCSGFLRLIIKQGFPPDLASNTWIFGDQRYLHARLCCLDRRGDSRGTCPDNQDVKGVHDSYSCEFTSMPGSHTIWQLLQCGVPLIVTRHSKQMPIPQSGPRGSPVTEVRQGCPASIKATAA